MNRYLQILCLTVFCLFASSQSWANGEVAPAQAMNQQVRQWLAQTHGVAANGVDIAPLDSRIQVKSCTTPLAVDHPFASRDTVRVRCPQPGWQLYLQVSFNAPRGQNPAQAKATLVVPKRLLQRGTLLKPDMVEEINAAAQPGDMSLLSSAKDVEFAELVRDIRAGEPIRSSDLSRAIMVRQGQQVNMVVGEKSTFQVMVRLEALQDGRMGEQVRLKNAESGRQISGVVTGPNQVKGL